MLPQSSKLKILYFISDSMPNDVELREIQNLMEKGTVSLRNTRFISDELPVEEHDFAFGKVPNRYVLGAISQEESFEDESFEEGSFKEDGFEEESFEEEIAPIEESFDEAPAKKVKTPKFVKV